MRGRDLGQLPTLARQREIMEQLAAVVRGELDGARAELEAARAEARTLRADFDRLGAEKRALEHHVAWLERRLGQEGEDAA
jgi:predicted  nucleic acid-binding Zn-ribbon protein